MTDDERTPRTQEELFERIKATSKDEFILEDMIRLGFWPGDKPIPQGIEAEIRRIGRQERELAAVRTELKRLQDEEALLAEIHKQRLQKAKQRRQENKTRRENERLSRAETWKKNRASDIIYLGDKISAGLGKKENDRQRLNSFQLPIIATAEELARAIDIPVGELRFLTFSREVSKTSHYKRFYIPKKTGGQRLISAPMPRLKLVQYWILENILAKVPVHHAAHGFIPGRSIVSNAQPHIAQDVVVNIDLKDFFPGITYCRVKGMFRALGYSEQVATILGLICTEPECDPVVLDNQEYYVSRGPRHLPQGAPTSPMITNIICRRLDKRLDKLANTSGFIYSRYADDITFSGSKAKIPDLGKLLGKTKNIVRHEGFFVHPDKTRVLHKGRRQEVTGIVVNHQLSVNRKTLRRLRAVLFQIEKDGIQGKTWKTNNDGCTDIIAAVDGYAHFVSMVDKAKGASFLKKITHIKKTITYKKKVYPRYGKGQGISRWKDPQKILQEKIALPTLPVTSHDENKPGEPKKKKWWKFW